MDFESILIKISRAAYEKALDIKKKQVWGNRDPELEIKYRRLINLLVSLDNLAEKRGIELP